MQLEDTTVVLLGALHITLHCQCKILYHCCSGVVDDGSSYPVPSTIQRCYYYLQLSKPRAFIDTPLYVFSAYCNAYLTHYTTTITGARGHGPGLLPHPLRGRALRAHRRGGDARPYAAGSEDTLAAGASRCVGVPGVCGGGVDVLTCAV
jgi:hypothetical protein